MKELCVDKSRHRAFFTVSVSVLLGGAVLFPTMPSLLCSGKVLFIIKVKSLFYILRS